MEPTSEAYSTAKFAGWKLVDAYRREYGCRFVTAFPAFGELRAELEAPFRDAVVFRQRTGGPKGDLVDDEFGRVLQVPGWSNIFTQPIVNRIEMLSTGVRTDIGIKVFGPDLETITRVCQQIEAAVKPVNGARDVVGVGSVSVPSGGFVIAQR